MPGWENGEVGSLSELVQDVSKYDAGRRSWVREAVRAVQADAARSSDTHLLRFPSPRCRGVDLYLKDESTLPTGSLKHRLARSLFLYALCNGWIHEGQTIIESSSGSTAVSEAYFAQLLGLPFIAVVPAATSPAKLALIEQYGGTCHPVSSAGDIYAAARQLAQETGGFYMDQFTFAERATDWRGNNNVAESIFGQMAREPHPEPTWIVVSAGTGGTSATIGRYLRYTGAATRLCVADPEGSAFFDGWCSGETSATGTASRIEGIGRPRMEESFLPSVVDRMIRVPDRASVEAMRYLRSRMGRVAGPSTGTNLVAAAVLAQEMADRGEEGSIVTLLCDDGHRYTSTYDDEQWLAVQGMGDEELAVDVRRSLTDVLG